MFNLLFSFEGRIGRQKYWLGSLGISVILVMLTTLVISAVGVPLPTRPGQPPDVSPTLLAALTPIMVLQLWITLALSAKRGHDRGRSGWWQLLNFVPLANVWLAIDQGFLRGVDATNEWGPPAVPLESAM